jgi:hypothetical protein
MKKTTVYLEPELDSALARLAAREGVTKAEVIRRSLWHAAADAPKPRMAVGVARSTPPATSAEELDRLVAKLLEDELDAPT